MLVPPTVVELANFTGRSSSSFGQYAVQALAQSTLLFQLATELTTFPEELALSTLAKNGILDMADKIYLNQPYRETTATPFQSETIGSYSYSKAVSAVKKGDSTGVMWFDLAVNKLKLSGSGIVGSGSISGMEYDGIEPGADGRYKIIGASGSRQIDTAGAWEIDTRYPFGDVL
jgi:hypothetical protein